MRKKILLLPLILFSLLSLQGCYTQLAWFHEPDQEETVSDEIQRASQRPSLLMYGNQYGSGNFYNRYRLRTYDPIFWEYYSYSPYNTLYSDYYYPGSFYYPGGTPTNGYWPYDSYNYGYVLPSGLAGSDKSPRSFTRGTSKKAKTNLVINRDKASQSQKTSSSWSSGTQNNNKRSTSSISKTNIRSSSTSSRSVKSSRSSRSSGSSKRVTRRN